MLQEIKNINKVFIKEDTTIKDIPVSLKSLEVEFHKILILYTKQIKTLDRSHLSDVIPFMSSNYSTLLNFSNFPLELFHMLKNYEKIANEDPDIAQGLKNALHLALTKLFSGLSALEDLKSEFNLNEQVGVEYHKGEKVRWFSSLDGKSVLSADPKEARNRKDKEMSGVVLGINKQKDYTSLHIKDQTGKMREISTAHVF